jgi:ribonuclease HI
MYIQDMGSAISVKKSFLFASDGNYRDWLKEYYWSAVASTLRVAANFRDLGAHLNLSGSCVGTTLTKRLHGGLARTHRVRRLPYSYEDKCEFVSSAVLSASLYGCEATHVSEAALGRLSTAILDTVSPYSKRRSSSIVFSVLPKEVDPEAVILIRRVSMLRRMIVKNPFVLEYVKDIHDIYCAQEFPGTHRNPPHIIPVPAKGTAARRAWRAQYMARGPIGFMLLSLSEFSMHLSPEREIMMPHEVEFSIMNTPWQYLHRLLRSRICTHRANKLSTSRSIFQCQPPIDFEFLRRGLASFKDADDRRIINWHVSLSSINNSIMHTYSQHDTGACSCGAAVQSQEHLLWHCTHTAHLRSSNPIIAKLARIEMPEPLKLGIPTQACSDPAGDLWGFSRQTWGQVLDVFGIRQRFGDVECKANDTFSNIKHMDTTGFAKTLFLQAKGTFGSLDLGDPSECSAEAPEEPNVWTDGSLKAPAYPSWSLGGFGLVHENRSWNEDAMHPNETIFAHSRQEGDDLHIWAPLPGPLCSSTRTELAAATLAVSAPGPIHIASDSRNFICLARNILNRNVADVVKRPWGLYPDGDLWEIFQRHVALKGHHAVRVKWVKGHCGPSDVDSGRISLRDMSMNNVADQLADLGVRSDSFGLASLGTLYVFRLQIYAKVLKAIHEHIIAVHRSEKDRRDKAKQNSWTISPRLGLIRPVLPFSPQLAHTRQIQIRLIGSHGIPNDSYLYWNICAFLSALHFAPLQGKGEFVLEQGTSWIEMLVLFEL